MTTTPMPSVKVLAAIEPALAEAIANHNQVRAEIEAEQTKAAQRKPRPWWHFIGMHPGIALDNQLAVFHAMRRFARYNDAAYPVERLRHLRGVCLLVDTIHLDMGDFDLISKHL